MCSLLFSDFNGDARGQFVGTVYHYVGMPAALSLFTIIGVVGLILASRALRSFGHVWQQHITGLLVCAMGAVEIFILVEFHSILPPAFDGGHTYSQALDLLRADRGGGTLPYFQIYPNNTAVTVVRYWIYRFLCGENAHLFIDADHLVCALALNIGIYFTWKLVVSLFNLRIANMTLILILMCLPLFFYTTYFYTDSLTMMVPPVLTYLTYRAWKTGQFRFLAGCALLLAASYPIRENIILLLPALFIFWLMHRKFKRVLCWMAVLAVFFIGVGAAVNNYEAHLGFKANSALKMPASNWILMGLSEDGRYNTKDFLLAKQQTNPLRKQAVDWAAIKQRLAQKGIGGLAETWIIKAARTFADGSFGYYWYTQHSQTFSQTYSYLFGNRRQIVLNLLQCVRAIEMVLSAFAALRLLRRKNMGFNFLIQLCLFGSFMFYVFIWEAEPRYALLFQLLQIITCTYGLQELSTRLIGMRQIMHKSRKACGLALVVPIILLAATLGVAVACHRDYVQTKWPQARYLVNQTTSNNGEVAAVTNINIVHQTFVTQSPFTTVRFRVQRCEGLGRYRATVTAANGQVVSDKHDLTSRGLKAGHDLQLNVSKLPRDHQWHHYTLTIAQSSGERGARLSLSMNGKGWYEQTDQYTNGSLYFNQQMQKGQDLRFQVYTTDNTTYLSAPIYWGLFAVPIFISIACFFALVRLFYLPVYKRELLW